MKHLGKIIAAFIFLLNILQSQSAFSQINSLGLKVISDTSIYLEAIRRNPDNRLVDLTKVCPGIRLDIKYAGKDNFLKEAVYTSAVAYARLPVARDLCIIQAEFEKQGLGLKIFDAYRPYAVTLQFYEKVKDSTFVASPYTGSRHNRGCAIDLTLVELKTGKELLMPTEFDDFSPKASPGCSTIPAEAKKNRDLLISIMEKHGFTVYPAEWWHYDHKGWQSYDLMDISFEQLKFL
ncbi:MAG: M15 family metallopeptidase [Bacteroidales bacterium]|nr:M15 family metallopeptidase [Bacteroidales bacterium]